MPVLPGAPGPRSTTTQFQILLYRPLYWRASATGRSSTTALSLARRAGLLQRRQDRHDQHEPELQVVRRPRRSTRSDVLFFIDEVRAAVKENARRTSAPTRKGDFPDNVVSATAPSTAPGRAARSTRPTTRAGSPTPSSAYITPMPSTAWNIAAAGGPHLELQQPGEREEDLRLPQRAVQEALDLRHQPAVAGRRRAVQADRVQPDDRRQHDGAEPDLRRPAEGACSRAEGRVLRLLDGGVQRDARRQADQGIVPPTTCRRCRGSRAGLQRLRLSRASVSTTSSSTSRTRPTTGTRSSASSTSGRRWPTCPTRPAIIHGVFDGAAAPAYGPVPAIPQTAYVPANAATNPYPYSIAAASQLLSSHGWKVVPGRHHDLPVARAPARPTVAPGSRRGRTIELHRLLHQRPGERRPGDDAAGRRRPSQVGIKITPVAKTFNFIVDQYDDPVAPQNNNKWQVENYGGFTENTYPTTDTIFNTGGSDNEGDYSSTDRRQADQGVEVQLQPERGARTRRRTSPRTCRRSSCRTRT